MGVFSRNEQPRENQLDINSFAYTPGQVTTKPLPGGPLLLTTRRETAEYSLICSSQLVFPGANSWKLANFWVLY